MIGCGFLETTEAGNTHSGVVTGLEPMTVRSTGDVGVSR